MYRLILTRRLHTTNIVKVTQKVRLFDQLPGEGGKVKKGLEELLGPLRAANFQNPNPLKTVGYDHFDVAIGKLIYNKMFINISLISFFYMQKKKKLVVVLLD